MGARLKAKGKKAPWDIWEEITGYSLPVLVASFEKLIASHSTPIKRGRLKGFGRTNTSRLLRDWQRFLFRISGLEKGDRSGRWDGNMRAALLVGGTLLGWYLKVHRAKAMDPRRPIAHRTKAYQSRNRALMQFLDFLFDPAPETIIWKDQEWENPHLPTARDGDFGRNLDKPAPKKKRGKRP